MSIARRSLLSLVLFATTALLGACLPGGGNARAPIPQALIPAGAPATRLVVVLPGRGDDIAALRASGIVSDRYGVTALPNMFIIGQDGLIAQTHRGYSEDVLQSFMQELLELLPEEALQRQVDAP